MSIIAAIEFVREHADAQGWVVDVRTNSGGDELLARRLAACFVRAPRVYARSRIRDPESSRGFSGPFERVVEPAENGPRITAPIAVLMGPACMSSCESFLLMLHEPDHHRWFGARSWGSSGNPRAHELGHGITLLIPSWIDLTPEGEMIESKGLTPDVPVAWVREVGVEADPVLDASLEWLRASCAQPGKNGP
jgi:C-terminal processing protease CtpA/Prc